MTDDHESLKHDLDRLHERIEQKRARMQKYGVLDREADLAARQAAIEVQRLREASHAGEPPFGKHGTNAADRAALRTQIDYWTALVDREFKSAERTPR